jgi:hypothetical protein
VKAARKAPVKSRAKATKKNQSLLLRAKSYPKSAYVAAILLAIVGIFVWRFVGAASTTVIKEDFTSSAANFTTLKGGTWGVAGGEYRLSQPCTEGSSDSGNCNYAVHKTAVKGDFTQEVAFRVTATDAAYNDATVIFNWVDPSNYMFASFNEKSNDFTNGIFKMTAGQQTRLAAFSATTTPGAGHQAKIQRTGNVYSVWRDGALLGQVTNSSLTGGRFGLGSRNDSVAFDNLVVTVPVDTQAPTAPVSLTKTGVTSTSISVSWIASADNDVVSGYKVYVNGVERATVAGTTYTATGLAASTTYSIAVAAKDPAGNVSAKSAPISVTTAGQGFVHPGVFVGRSQLDFVKAKVAAGQEPWTTAYNKVKSSSFSSLSRNPSPVTSIACGNGGSTIRVGCDQVQNDAVAAYNDALLWYYSGDSRYAQKAIQHMNAWSAMLTEIKWDGTSKYGNGKLVAGWSGANWVRAAEIIRYSNAGWSAADIARFEQMLKNVFLPRVIDGWTGGGFNWMTTFADLTVNIGVFTNDRAVYDNGVGDWRRMVKAHMYLTSDGSVVVPAELTGASKTPAAYWGMGSLSSPVWVNGQTQETCRDLSHVAMGISSAVYTAETARLQGLDLYGEQATRLRAALETEALLIRLKKAADAGGARIPSTYCGGTINWGGEGYRLTGDVALNEFAGRRGLSMPELSAFVNQHRPIPNGTHNLHMQAETLTHANSASVK